MSRKLPLSTLQKEIWVNQMLYPAAPMFNVGGYACIDGVLDVKHFEQALKHVLYMHDALRIRLHQTGGVPQQSITDDSDVRLQIKDFKGQAAVDWIQQQHTQAFSLYEQPLYHFALCKISDKQYYWYTKYHYLIADGKTLALVIQDVTASYNALLKGGILPAKPDAGYGDYVDADQHYMRSAQYNTDRRYWQEKYATLPPPLLYPQHADELPPGGTIPSERTTLSLPRKLFEQLESFAAAQQLLTGDVLLGLLYTYFARLNRQADQVIGMISLLHRETADNHSCFERSAGFFLNVIPVRYQLSLKSNFSALLQSLQKQLHDDIAHARLPLGEINRLAQLNRENGQRTQLFELELAYIDFDCDVSFGDAPLQFHFLTHGHEQYALTVYAERFHAAGDVAVHFDYNCAWFNRAEMALLAGRFEHLLRQVVQFPDTPVSELAFMPDAERIQILQVFNATEQAHPAEQCVHQLFEAQAAQTPTAIAAISVNESLTYAELNRRANQLAHYLRSVGIQPDTLVGVCVERSPEMLVSLLGILKAGGAYVPLDPAYPRERLAFMLEDTRVPVLLTQSKWLANLPDTSAQVVCLDQNRARISQYPQNNPDTAVSARHLAYVIYTSGSTGRPKGVMLEHQGLCNLALDHARRYGIQANSRVLQFVSLNFDVATADIFMTLCAGATLYLPLPADQALENGLVQTLRKQTITHCQLPAAVLASLPTHIPLPDLQVIATGGEVPATSMVKQWSVGRRYFNVYGPTETTVCATMYECSGDTLKPSIGFPVTNTQVYVLDESRQPVPVGVAGELYIGGVGVARGYLNRPQLSADRFVSHPFSTNPQARLYKTGDRVRHLPDGNLEFLGRIDQQIKIRGFRVELGEIEQAISQHPTVRDNVVVLHESASHGKRLVAYLITQPGSEFQRSTLQAYLKTKLPEYMQPAAWVTLAAMPFTPNGKVDRKALAQREVDYQTTSDFSEPRTDTERQLVACWQTVLGLERIGIHHNFFELGGDSLSGMQLVTQLQEAFGQVFQLADVFRYPTIAAFAERLQHTAKTLDEQAIRPADSYQAIPLSFSQEEIWQHVRQSPGDTSFNICNAFRLQGAVRQDILQQSLSAIMQRHSLLRNRFHEQAGQAVQSVVDTTRLILTTRDISTLSAAQQQDETARQLSAEENQPFDLQQAPLWRTRLLYLGQDSYVLIVCFHHIIEDAWSIRVLLQELTALYTAFASGQTSPLPPLSIQYADFALWQRRHYTPEVLQNRYRYWQSLLQDKPAPLRLPVDKPFTLVENRKTYQSGMESFTLPAAQITPLRALGQQQGASLSVVLLANYITLLHHNSGQHDLVIGMPMSKRNHHQVEPLMGYFSGMSVLRVQLPPAANFLTILATVREAMQQTMENQNLTLKQVWNGLQLPWSGEQQLLFRTAFNFIPVPRQTLRMTDVTLEPMALKREKMVRDLVIGLWDKDGTGTAFEGFFRYRRDLFEPATIRHLVMQFQDLLEKVIKQPECPINKLLTTPKSEQVQIKSSIMTTANHETINDLSDLIVAYLEQLGVEYVFGVPGAHISALYEALERSAQRGGPRAILTRHETGAANMADGYARETGRLGVCCATTGPGATNLVTGIASSYTDHTPLLVLTGQTPLAKFGMAAFQESSPDMMDTTAMLSHCTYYSSVVTHAAQLENKLAKALMTALRTPRGPVHLSIPIDLSRVSASGLSFPALPRLLSKPPATLDTDAVDELTEMLLHTRQQGQKTVILVGHECAGATDTIMALADYLDASVVTTQRGKTWADPFHPRVKGVFGYAGHESARQALTHESVDLILAAGTGLGQWSTSAWDKALLNDKLVHIHPLSDYFSRSPMAGLHVQGAIKTVFDALLKSLQQQGCEPVSASAPPTVTDSVAPSTPTQITVRDPEGYQQDRSPIHPQRLVHELMQGHFPAETRFIVDTTNWLPWTIQYFFTRQHQNYRLSSELAAMGWGLGAAVGTALGSPGTPVVCLVGDGGVLMNGQEITVAVQEKLPVIYLILNDGIYGMVQHRHRQVSDADIAFSFPRTNFKKMAEAVGAQGFRIHTIDELLQLDFAAICNRAGPTVLDIVIDPNITPPMGMF